MFQTNRNNMEMQIRNSTNALSLETELFISGVK